MANPRLSQLSELIGTFYCYYLDSPCEREENVFHPTLIYGTTFKNSFLCDIKSPKQIFFSFFHLCPLFLVGFNVVIACMQAFGAISSKSKALYGFYWILCYVLSLKKTTLISSAFIG